MNLLPLTFLFPLVGFLLLSFSRGKWSENLSALVGVGSVGLAALSAFWAIWSFHSAPPEGGAYTLVLWQWMNVDGFAPNFALYLDGLSVTMLGVVTGVGFLIHLFASWYMRGEAGYSRFFAYTNLFIASMLFLVLGDNLLFLYFGWEGVGLCSYLLIGFYYSHVPNGNAALKAFIVTRVGDVFMAFGLFILFQQLGTLNIQELLVLAPQHFAQGDMWVSLAALALLGGAVGKSAQLPLQTWLADAMAGPTPVSALIHAATMVTAGVFMLARLSPLFELSHSALTVVTFIGATTAFFAATVGLVQNDIKRVIAYSTCSQLGYMFVALGVGAYGAAIFHLFTHAFFKALLFLGSGSVIHAMSDEQDMRNMGGIRKLIPTTYWMMIIGTIALTGVGIPATVIGTAGFFSKDAIIESAFVGHNAVAGFAFTLLVIAACFTSFYSWRLIFMTFHGKSRASEEVLHHVHESPPVMLVPLYILAVGALFAGFLFHDQFIGDAYEAFWKTALFTSADNHVLHEMHGVPMWVKLSPFVAMVIGFLVSYQFYIRSPETPKRLAAQHRGLYAFLLNKWYFDELYDFLFVRSAKALGRFLWKTGDGKIIDGLGPDGVSARVIDVTQRVVKLQSGYLYHYAFAMLIGVAALATWMML